ncbi:hypothetical protein Hanom_Chr00s050890g01779851 [Helianthus anomalus]
MMARVIFSSIPCSGKRQRQQSRVLLGSRLKTLGQYVHILCFNLVAACFVYVHKKGPKNG